MDNLKVNLNGKQTNRQIWEIGEDSYCLGGGVIACVLDHYWSTVKWSKWLKVRFRTWATLETLHCHTKYLTNGQKRYSSGWVKNEKISLPFGQAIISLSYMQIRALRISPKSNSELILWKWNCLLLLLTLKIKKQSILFVS